MGEERGPGQVKERSLRNVYSGPLLGAILKSLICKLIVFKSLYNLIYLFTDARELNPEPQQTINILTLLAASEMSES